MEIQQQTGTKFVMNLWKVWQKKAKYNGRHESRGLGHDDDVEDWEKRITDPGVYRFEDELRVDDVS